MPSKGINFLSAKPKVKSSTRKWEHDLGGLSLALHRVNKAATVARGRAITKVKATTTYTEASEEIRQKWLQAIDNVNQKRDLKRAEAEQQWIELYGEEDDLSRKHDEMQADEDGEDDDEGRDVDSSTSESVESQEGDNGESEDDVVEEEDYSEAEEDDEGDAEEEDVELSQEQQEALTNKLLVLRVRQSQEQQAFIAMLETRAKTRGVPERPDDYVFGSGR
jgi:hypothetical protein